jgi:hypothetical protein
VSVGGTSGTADGSHPHRSAGAVNPVRRPFLTDLLEAGADSDQVVRVMRALHPGETVRASQGTARSGGRSTNRWVCTMPEFPGIGSVTDGAAGDSLCGPGAADRRTHVAIKPA